MNDTTDNNHFRLDENQLRANLSDSNLANWTEQLIGAVQARPSALHHGDLPRWTDALNALPDLPIERIDLDHESGVAVLTKEDIAAEADAATATNSTPSATTNIGTQTTAYELSPAARSLEPALAQLKPWRKGPFRIAHVTIDSEWRSDWKWNRVYPHISPLNDRTVLDVGCGNGYHLWRMRSQGASNVLGIDPNLLFMTQFQALQHYINDSAVNMLPLTMETMPDNMHCFDTVFSMGVLYHRKEPHAHLRELMHALKPGGELVLETLVSLGEERTELKIEERYARMKNIWSLPSVPMLARWMVEAGFKNIRCVSVDITSRLEQRTTEWMQYESLIESLDPDNLSLTVEGLPRPRRAVMVANAPADA